MVLHNLCEIHKDQFNDDWLDNSDEAESDNNNAYVNTTCNSSAISIRDALKTYIINHPL